MLSEDLFISLEQSGIHLGRKSARALKKRVDTRSKQLFKAVQAEAESPQAVERFSKIKSAKIPFTFVADGKTVDVTQELSLLAHLYTEYSNTPLAASWQKTVLLQDLAKGLRKVWPNEDFGDVVPETKGKAFIALAFSMQRSSLAGYFYHALTQSIGDITIIIQAALYLTYHRLIHADAYKDTVDSTFWFSDVALRTCIMWFKYHELVPDTYMPPALSNMSYKEFMTEYNCPSSEFYQDYYKYKLGKLSDQEYYDICYDDSDIQTETLRLNSAMYYLCGSWARTHAGYEDDFQKTIADLQEALKRDKRDCTIAEEAVADLTAHLKFETAQTAEYRDRLHKLQDTGMVDTTPLQQEIDKLNSTLQSEREAHRSTQKRLTRMTQQNTSLQEQLDTENKAKSALNMQLQTHIEVASDVDGINIRALCELLRGRRIALFGGEIFYSRIEQTPGLESWRLIGANRAQLTSAEFKDCELFIIPTAFISHKHRNTADSIRDKWGIPRLDYNGGSLTNLIKAVFNHVYTPTL